MILRFRLTLFFSLFAWLVSCATPEDPVYPHPPSFGAASIPPRASNALSGSRFAASIQSSGEERREALIRDQFLLGNIPNFMRRPAVVRFRAVTRSGRNSEVVLWVLPDYLAIGSDQDYVRMPMNPLTAQVIADRYRMRLPTSKMVDAIYQAALLKLDPHPFKPGRDMVTVKEFIRHNQVIQGSLRNKVPNALVAGHKKDIVVSNLLRKKPKRVAIYGWHRRNGQPIQPLTTVHGNWYADYSHGTRLILNAVMIDGRTYTLTDVLANPEFAPLLSYEGTLQQGRYPVEEGVGRKKWWPKS